MKSLHRPSTPPTNLEIAKLLEDLSSQESQIYRTSARKLREIGSPQAVAGLLKALECDRLAWIAWALGQIGSPAAVTGLIEALNHKANCVRVWAAWALGQIRSESAVMGLLQALNNEDYGVRWRAAAALGKIGGEAAIAGLLPALEDQDFYVRWRVACALGEIGSKALACELEHCVPEKIACALEKIGHEAAVVGLLQALNREDPVVRGSAAWALGEIGSDAAVAGLIRALNHQDSYVRGKAAYVLGKMGCSSAVPGLLQALADKDFQVRWRTASALGKIGLPSSAIGLLQAVSDEHVFVRGAAVVALGKIATPEAVRGLLQALDDERYSVRYRAAQALENIGTPEAVAGLLRYCADVDSRQQTEQLNSADVIVTDSQSKQLPKIFITSCADASTHLMSETRGSRIKHLISIGSPGAAPPQGYTQVSHRLRLEFHDIHTPQNDPSYVLATSEDILKVIDFVSSVSQFEFNLLIHCQAGISRSTAVALTICAQILGAGKEQEALAYVMATRPQAVPNRWLVELADDALGRGGKLVEATR